VRLRRDAKADLLRSVPLFAHCTRAQLKRIATIADEVTVGPGKQLMRQGDRGREMLVLLDGTVEVRKNGRKLAERGPGDFVGEISLVTRAPRIATVTTRSEVTALVITARDFRTLLREAPEIQTKVLQALAERLAPESI
jgi:CRP/FNR family cyclic AMP-dependent transcriptional regulator